MNDLPQKPQSNIGAVMPRLSKVLTQSEIQQLYPLVNSDRDWKIDVNSHQLVDKIIELWFETQGYDFWDNPFPEVVEWTVSKDKEIEFVYVLNEIKSMEKENKYPNRIAVIGNSQETEKTIETLLLEKNLPEVIIVNPPIMERSDIFEINGVLYEPRRAESKSVSPKFRSLMGLMAMTGLMSPPIMNYGESGYERELPKGIDIKKEYGLIQQKKSKLSKWERDKVCRVFEYNYHIVTS